MNRPSIAHWGDRLSRTARTAYLKEMSEKSVNSAQSLVVGSMTFKSCFVRSELSMSVAEQMRKMPLCNINVLMTFCRLRELANHLEHGSIPNSVLQKTLQYAAYVLDTVSMDETRYVHSAHWLSLITHHWHCAASDHWCRATDVHWLNANLLYTLPRDVCSLLSSDLWSDLCSDHLTWSHMIWCVLLCRRKRPVPVSVSRRPGPIRAPSEPSPNALARNANQFGPKPLELESAVAKTSLTAPVVTNSSKQWTENCRSPNKVLNL